MIKYDPVTGCPTPQYLQSVTTFFAKSYSALDKKSRDRVLINRVKETLADLSGLYVYLYGNDDAIEKYNDYIEGDYNND